MRPEILFPLFAPVQSLPGIGPRIAKAMEKITGASVAGALFHLPTALIDRRLKAHADAYADTGKTITLKVRVREHVPAWKKSAPYRIFAETGAQTLVLTFFHAKEDYLKRILPVGTDRIVSGKLDLHDGLAQIVHPDHVLSAEEAGDLPDFEPVYPLTAGVTLKTMRKAVAGGLDRLPDLPEWQNDAWLKKNDWPAFSPALRSAHAPARESDLSPEAPARSRLAYDELLSNQLALALVRNRTRAAGQAVQGDSRLRNMVIAALPYALTGDQMRTLAEIEADMAAPVRMMRLVQGDVGSGKTIVTFLALLTAIEAGGQGALMAPTEILARQHGESLAPLARAAGIRIEVLTGRNKGKKREALLEDLAGGRIDLLIGTHALFQESVGFANLTLAVVDEQHRFGVHQRLMLSAKGQKGADVLVMTATPIPRTLSLTHYGDMDVSLIREKPPGRKTVETRAIPTNRAGEVIEGLARAMARGDRIYWVCPLIEESETLDVTAAEDRFTELNERFPGFVGLVHGRMTGDQKDTVMERFASGEIPILVATTVIEVGVNVPDATVMVVENSELFGLAQLHQLRGRVGRGDRASTCLLLYQAPLGETAKARLDILRKTEDGFLIAEEDLRLRGAGEVLGTRQSGLPEFLLADMSVHGPLLEVARDDAKLILSTDNDLTGPRGPALRVLLYLFSQDRAIRYLRSG